MKNIFRLSVLVLSVAAFCAGDYLNFVLLMTLNLFTSEVTSFVSCTLTPITKDLCKKCRAGIACIWVIPCDAVEELIFDEDRQVTSIVVDAAHPDPTFKKIEFEKNTAFFNQEKTKVKNNINVTQTISFIIPCMSCEVRNALEDLNTCCCMHAIVKDNGGNYHYSGVSYFPDTGEWQEEDLVTGDGSGNTGADPTSDSNEYIETLTATTCFYAPCWVGGEAAIPV